MSAIFAGFMCALVLAVFVIMWITYCMFFKERHKSEKHQYDIQDIRFKNMIISQDKVEEPKKKKDIVAGVFILPSRRKHQDDDYGKRPDYPESPVPAMQPGVGDFVDVLNESVRSDTAVDSFEIESSSHYHSDV